MLAIPTLWLAKPWTWELPTYSKVIGIGLLPFLAAFAAYYPMLFVISIIGNYTRQKRAFLRFLAVIALYAVLLVLAGVYNGFEPLPSAVLCVAGVIASVFLRILFNRRPNPVG